MKPLPRILVQVQYGWWVQVQMVDEHPKQDNFPKLSVFQKISIWRLLSPLNWKFFNHNVTTLPICQPQIGTFRRRHIGKELMKEFVNEFMDFYMVFIWIVSGEDMYPLITPWYVKSIFHRWKMIVKVEGACLQKFCRQFVAAEAYRLSVEKFRFQMSQKNYANLGCRQRSGKTTEALGIAKSIPWSLEMMSLPVKDISALKKNVQNIVLPKLDVTMVPNLRGVPVTWTFEQWPKCFNPLVMTSPPAFWWFDAASK